MDTYGVELSIIASLQMDPKMVGRVYGKLSPEMFTSATLGRIYLEYIRAYDLNKTPTIAEIQQNCISDDYPQQDINYAIFEAAKATVLSTDIIPNADVIAREYRVRQGENLIRNTKLEGSKVDEQIGSLITGLEGIMVQKKIETMTLSQIAAENRANYFTAEKKAQLYTGTCLDKQIGGLEPGDVAVIAARPAVGKSVFSGQLALNWAKAGIRVGYFNLEMQPSQMYERWLANESGIAMQQIRKATSAADGDWRRFEIANEVFTQIGGNLYLTSGPKTVSDIKRESRHMDYDVMIIDYMQLLTPEGAYQGNRAAEVADISRGIKSIAMEYKIPVIAMSQLNRASETRRNNEPSMAELRESGAIEQDASIVVLMWKNEDNKEMRFFNVAKCRQGIPGKCSMMFDGSHARFIDDENPFTEKGADNG